MTPTLHRNLARSRGLTLAALLLLLVAASPVLGQVIDDFESYTGEADLQDTWRFALLDTTSPNRGSGTQSASREGLNLNHGSGMFILREFDPPLDLTGVDAVVVWVRRHPASAPTLWFRLAVRDGDGFSCVPGDEPDITDSDWHQLYLDLEERCGFVNVADITQITINVSNKSGAPGDVFGSFDDLELVDNEIFSDGFELGGATAWEQP